MRNHLVNLILFSYKLNILFHFFIQYTFYSVETTIVSLMGPSDSEIKITTLDSEIKLPSLLFISGITLVIDRPFECEEIETGQS